MPATAAAHPGPSLRQLGALYFFQDGGLGSWYPFLGLAMARSGYDGVALGAVLAAFPLVRLLGGPLQVGLSDRFRQGDRLLRWSSLGTLAMAGVAVAALDHPLGFGVAILLLALVRAPLTPLVDALTLTAAERTERGAAAYGGVRFWGSVGYLSLAAAGAGLAWLRPEPAAPMLLTVGVWAAAAALTHRLPPMDLPEPAPILPALRGLFASRPLVLFFAALSLHGVGLSTYDGLYSFHIESLGLPAWWTGAGLAAGLLVEIPVLALGWRLMPWLRPRRMVALALVVSVVRWGLTAWLEDPVLLTLVQALHGVSFAFYWLGAVETLRRRAPPQIRASAQALLLATTFGIGSLLSSALTMALLDEGGTRLLFALGAAAAALAAVLLGLATVEVGRGRRAGGLLGCGAPSTATSGPLRPT